MKVPALKIEFIEILINRWYNDYQGLMLADFLKGIAEEFGDNFQDHIVPGDTGVFIDDNVLLKLNIYQPRGGKAEWDKDCAYLLFGTDQNPGLYTFNNDGNKIYLNSVQSSDVRIWNFLSIFILQKYTIKRWGSSQDAVRLFIKSLSNVNVSRHSILRLYWSAKICYDPTREIRLELLDTLWKTEDFMTQVTERSTCSMSNPIKYFLEYCSRPENSVLFSERSSEGEAKFRKLIKLILADNNVLAFTMMSKENVDQLLDQNKEICGFI